jgi:predicted DNA-binding protein with PD1-like motif
VRSKSIDQASDATHILVFETGDDVLSLLTAYAREHRLSAAHFTAIGALQRVTLGYFDWHTKKYVEIPVEEQVEVVSLLGDIARKDGEPQVHAHIVVGRRDGSTRAGHLLAATVRPTVELVLVETPAYLKRVHDPESGLALIDPGA